MYLPWLGTVQGPEVWWQPAAMLPALKELTVYSPLFPGASTAFCSAGCAGCLESPTWGAK